MYELGSKVLVTGEYEDMEFDNDVAYIFRLEDPYGDNNCLLYIPRLVEECIGHGQAYEQWDFNSIYFEFVPHPSYGSWNVPRKWFTNGNITLLESLSDTLGPHWRVIKKIQQMKQRRKEMGYAF